VRAIALGTLGEKIEQIARLFDCLRPIRGQSVREEHLQLLLEVDDIATCGSTNDPEAAGAGSGAGLWLRHGKQTFSLGFLARLFFGATNAFRLFTGAPLRWFLVCSTLLHLSENAFPLHFLLEDS
jgi:hypothetical protein